MSLSKQQMIGAVGGGIFVLGALGLGWLLYSAWSEKGEAEEKLQSESDTYARYNSAAVYPSKASIESVKSNATSYAAWYDQALTLAARGDKVLPLETPPIFKQRLQGEVRRMLDLPGGVGGKIADAKFLFGFEQYLGEGGVLPKEEDVPRLAIQLDTICSLVDVFAEAGVYGVKSIVRVEEKAEKTENDEASSSQAKKKNAKKDEDKGPKRSKLTYQFEIEARPVAVVKTLNALASCSRFAVVRNFAFKTSSDVIVERLTAAEKAKADEAAPRTQVRRRGRGAAAQQPLENPEAIAAANRIISDPEGDEPITVTFTLDVWDFGKAAQAAEAKPAEEGKPAADEKASEQKPAEKKAEEKKGDKE